MERLQKVLAHSNVASRRKAEEMIADGRVKVNGQVMTEMGFKVSEKDHITVDGKLVSRANKRYFLLNKPAGYISTTKDEKNRKTVLDLLDEEVKQDRLYPVGRLDSDSAGLLLMTNDGELSHILMHPSHEVEKEYIVRVKGIVIRKEVIRLRGGLTLDDGYVAKPKYVRLISLDKEHQSSLFSIVLTEGRNREVRKLFDALGYPVKNLTRIRYDFLTLDGIERGSYRPLKVHEVKKLYAHKSLKK